MQTRATTAEQLLELPRGEYRYELVRGELRRMSPGGHVHGAIAARVAWLLGPFVEQHRLGTVYGAETGFLLERDPDTVRAPDTAFVRAARMPAPDRRGYFPGPPDLAVEVVSPSDRFTEVEEKALCWLRHGTAVVWVVNPEHRTVTVHRGGGEARVLGAEDELAAEDLLPGLSLQVADLFGR